MAVRTKEEIMNMVKDRIGDDVGDDAINFVNDISDTMDDLSSRANGDGIDWKQRYEQNDTEWRTKYRNRFFEPGEADDDDPGTKPEPKRPKTFDELFETKE